MTQVEAILLGTAQDAGLPQVGCRCARCAAAREDSSLARLPVSLALVDHIESAYWLIDATPALPDQCAFLQRRFSAYSLAGIFLTHAHAGHYPGLIHFGKEGWNTSQLPLYASGRMLDFLSENEPWARLVADNLCGIRIGPGEKLVLNSRLSVEARDVPHRAEFTDTFAYRISGPSMTLLYCPDIDGWHPVDLVNFFGGVDAALIDGTFYSGDELPGRDLSAIPHPFVSDSMGRLTGVAAKIWFIHLNHSNPLHDRGPERRAVEAAGFAVGEPWQRWQLG